MKSKIILTMLLEILLITANSALPAGDKTTTLAVESSKNPMVKSIRIILQEGARPHFSPKGDSFVFDRKNSDGYYDLYLADLEGKIINSLTENNLNINQKNNGNGVYHPSGDYIVFISEENRHLQDHLKYLADPGVGLYCNFWAIDVASKKAWRLTDIPVKKRLRDKFPVIAVVNPHFTPDGKTLIWTERYAKGGHHNWGAWRIKAATFNLVNGRPQLSSETILFTPAKGNYVTFMDFPGVKKLLFAGNLDGQHEYGMDQYVYDIPTKQLTNLTNTPEIWEEDSTVTHDGQIIYMTNQDSKYKYDFNNANWPSQPIERDYYIMKSDGSEKERLTYFNDPAAPEYIGKRTLVAASDISPDGKTLAASIGVDFGNEKRDVMLKIAVIELR